MAPIIIFDKSTLESLNSDEAVWLDQFFNSNITPLFYIAANANAIKSMTIKRVAMWYRRV